MKYTELLRRINNPYFFTYQVLRIFSKENQKTIQKQLTRLVNKKLIIRIKRGLYIFSEKKIDELELANIVYQPSYISLETALNLLGIIPDIPAQITSVTPITPNTFKTSRGIFSYSRIVKDLFFGYKTIKNPENNISYNLAEPEKALLDFIYLRKISNISEFRVDLSGLDKNKLQKYNSTYPNWVKKSLSNEY